MASRADAVDAGRRLGSDLTTAGRLQTETLTGNVAIHTAVPTNTTQPDDEQRLATPSPRSFVLMPAKNRATAKSTTAST